MTIFGVLNSNNDGTTSICIQPIVIYCLEIFVPTHLVFLWFFSFVLYGCDGVLDKRISFLPFSAREMVATWSKWTMTFGRSDLTSINTTFGNVVGLFERFATRIFIRTSGSGFTIPEAGRDFPFCMEFRCGAMLMHPALLILADLNDSVFGGISTRFPTLNRSSPAIFSCQSSIVVSASEAFVIRLVGPTGSCILEYLRLN